MSIVRIVNKSIKINYFLWQFSQHYPPCLPKAENCFAKNITPIPPAAATPNDVFSTHFVVPYHFFPLPFFFVAPPPRLRSMRKYLPSVTVSPEPTHTHSSQTTLFDHQRCESLVGEKKGQVNLRSFLFLAFLFFLALNSSTKLQTRGNQFKWVLNLNLLILPSHKVRCPEWRIGRWNWWMEKKKNAALKMLFLFDLLSVWWRMIGAWLQLNENPIKERGVQW